MIASGCARQKLKAKSLHAAEGRFHNPQPDCGVFHVARKLEYQKHSGKILSAHPAKSPQPATRSPPMTDQSPENAQPDKPSQDGGGGRSRPENNEFPPRIKWWQYLILSMVYIFQAASLLYLADLLLLKQVLLTRLNISSCVGGAYIAFGLLLAGLFLDRYLRHKTREHTARLKDLSEVEALFVEVDTVEPRLRDPQKPDNFDQKVEQLKDEVKRLKNLGPRGWTEYQILSLLQLLVDFLKLNELKAWARSSLAEREEYAEDSAQPYEFRQYYKWEERINAAIQKTDDTKKKAGETEEETGEVSDARQDDAAEQLRAELRSLFEHVADYDAKWAEGSAFIRDLMICGVVAVPVLLVMGLLPVLHPAGTKLLEVLNWGLLGISGSLTPVLLYLYQTNRVEVGDTEGKNALWRAVVSAPLGFVAGVLIYSIIWGKLLPPGAAVPDVTSDEIKNIGLSILWAIGAGFSFERVFDRLRSTIETRS